MRTVKVSLGDPLPRSVQDAARARLVRLRYDIWREADEYLHGSIPSAAFFLDVTITHLLNNVTAFTTVEGLHSAVASNHLLVPHATRLLEVLDDIRKTAAIEAPSTERAASVIEDEDVMMAGDDLASHEQGVAHHDAMTQDDFAMTSAQQSESSGTALGSQDRVVGTALESAGPIVEGTALVREMGGSNSGSGTVNGVPAHMCFSWHAGPVIDQQTSKRRAAKPASQRKVKKGRIENKENGSA